MDQAAPGLRHRTPHQRRAMRALCAVVLAALAAAPAAAYAPLGYPGSTWGDLTRDLNGVEGNGSQGKLIQGVHWLTLPWKVEAKALAGYTWRVRTEERRFYDVRGPVVGVEFTKGFLDVGADFSRQEFPRLGRTSDTGTLYGVWYRRRDLAKGFAQPRLLCIPIVGAPLSTWGKLSRDFDNFEGNGAQGFVSQGVDWAKLPGAVTLRSVVSYRWRFRTENRRFYNSYGPAVGLELSRKTFDLGIERFWRRYPELPRPASKEFQAYLTWYHRWDLKDLRKKK